MFDNLINNIKKPHDVEAAVSELISGVVEELQQTNSDANKLSDMVAWLQEHQTEIAFAISTEEVDGGSKRARKSRGHSAERHA